MGLIASATPLMLATGNPGKIREMGALLGIYLDLTRIPVLTPHDWPGPLPATAETGATFAENARLKAQALAQATGLPALADDSGLCVDALNGAPGVQSARWAGEGASDTERNARLLTALADLPRQKRTARFVCALAFATPDGKITEVEGICDGVILEAPRGTAGFGYDPLFLLPGSGRTMAELTTAEKNLVSHRATAFSHLGPLLRAFPFVLAEENETA